MQKQKRMTDREYFDRLHDAIVPGQAMQLATLVLVVFTGLFIFLFTR